MVKTFWILLMFLYEIKSKWYLVWWIKHRTKWTKPDKTKCKTEKKKNLFFCFLLMTKNWWNIRSIHLFWWWWLRQFFLSVCYVCVPHFDCLLLHDDQHDDHHQPTTTKKTSTDIYYVKKCCHHPHIVKFNTTTTAQKQHLFAKKIDFFFLLFLRFVIQWKLVMIFVLIFIFCFNLNYYYQIWHAMTWLIRENDVDDDNKNSRCFCFFFDGWLDPKKPGRRRKRRIFWRWADFSGWFNPKKTKIKNQMMSNHSFTPGQHLFN